jgi:hypothetical protein
MKQMPGWMLWLTPKVLAITLFPFGIYYRNEKLLHKTTLNHENIHWQQQKEMLCVFFYLWYIIEWLIKLIKYGKLSYYNISFEREAYWWDKDPTYLLKRKRFAWFKHVIKK